MEMILPLGALFVWPIFFLVSYLLIQSTPRKSRIFSFSDLGSTKKNGTKFDLLLILTGIFQIIFLLGFQQRFGLPIILLMVTSFFGILTGVIRQRGHLLAHEIACTIGFASSAPGWILLGLQIISLNYISGILLLIWGVTIVPLLVHALINREKRILKYEAYFFLGAFVTNLILLALG